MLNGYVRCTYDKLWKDIRFTKLRISVILTMNFKTVTSLTIHISYRINSHEVFKVIFFISRIILVTLLTIYFSTSFTLQKHKHEKIS